MTKKGIISASILLVLMIMASTGCVTATDTTNPSKTTGAVDTMQIPGNSSVAPSGTPPGTPPGNSTGAPSGTPPGAPPGNSTGNGMMGQPPGGSTGTSNYTLSGAYTVDNQTMAESNGTYIASTTNQSAIYVTNSGNLTLDNATILTTGNTSSSDASSFYGLNGAVLANNGSTVTITGGNITTTGSGANGAIPTGTGTTINLFGINITASGDGGHGVMATLGAALNLVDVNISTTGPHGAPLATDRGSGTVDVTRGTISSSGADSPGSTRPAPSMSLTR